MTAAERKVNLQHLRLDHSSKGTRFEGSLTEFGVSIGLFGLGAALYDVPPGKTATPFHRHHTSDEMFVVLSGSGTYRYGDEMIPIEQWDCVSAPAGAEGHQIINTGQRVLRYLAISNNTNADVTEYVDSGRIRVDVGAVGHHRENATFGACGRLVPMGYWEGEKLD